MEFILLIVLLLLSAFFSGSETALFSLGAGERAALADDPRRSGRKVAALLADSPRLLSALLIGNLMINTLASVVATSLLVRRMGPGGLAVAVPAMTVLLLLLGEITPKLTALRFRVGFSLRARPAIAVWVLVIKPVLDLLTAAAERLLGMLPMERTGSRPLEGEELATAAELAVSDGVLSETEGRFLARLLRLQNIEVREVMTPRPDVIGLNAADDTATAMAVAREAGYNRYPVFVGDAAQPEGFLHLKDLLARSDPEASLAENLRPPLFVPESKPVRSLLAELRVGGSHMAFVVDEHGDFSGLVTLEDCLETLTGPWADESDTEGPDLLPVGDGVWVADGGADIRRVNEVCGTDLEASRDYVTLGGLVMAALGRIPSRGDAARVGGLRIRVMQMDGRRVDRVRISRLPRDREERT